MISPSPSSSARAQPFGYVCGRCSRCCRQQRIQLNPYEAARIAHRLGLATREFRERHTIEGRGTELNRNADGSCAFLGAQGCTIHSDRPLVCRLYPLGRRISADGEESFHRLEGHAQSQGRFGDAGTIESFLQAQEAERFMTAADAYFAWVCRARERLAIGDGTAPAGGGDLFDMDETIAAHCAQWALPEPVDIEERRQLHLEILDRHLAAADLNTAQAHA